MRNTVILIRLLGTLVVCLAAPPLLFHYLGPALGALGAAGAAAFWYSQYHRPTWQERDGPFFWFVAGGYGVIGCTLLFCLGRLMGMA